VPGPERRLVECWQLIQRGSDGALDIMAKHRICGPIGGGSAEGGAVGVAHDRVPGPPTRVVASSSSLASASRSKY
jgi:hypothetical protein